MGLAHTVMGGFVSMLSPSGVRARLLIMIYHRVLPQPDPMRPEEIHASEFDWQMKLMAEQFNVMPLSEACRCLEAGTLPARAACITFDDGYADNLDVALPILTSYGLPATIFVATGFLGGGRMWNDTIIELVRHFDGLEWDLSELGLGRQMLGTALDRHRTAMALIYKLRHLDFDERSAIVESLESQAKCALPDDLMLTPKGVQEIISAGLEIGAHTVNHPILACLDEARARQEIVESRETLENITSQPVTSFAYPNGKFGKDYGHHHVAMVKEAGFCVAVSTQQGVAKRNGDFFQLPRFTPWQHTPKRFHETIIRSYFW